MVHRANEKYKKNRHNFSILEFHFIVYTEKERKGEKTKLFSMKFIVFIRTANQQNFVNAEIPDDFIYEWHVIHVFDYKNIYICIVFYAF
jgi:hypothetical protein